MATSQVDILVASSLTPWSLTMERTIKSPGGAVVRVLAAIYGFKQKYGYWPKAIETEPELIASISTINLTPLGFYRLQSKAELQADASGTVLATGEPGDVFDYGTEKSGADHESLKVVRAWIGLGDDQEAL